MKIGPFGAWIFDCDGVLLDSNSIKTKAFFELALPYGEAIAKAFVEHHVSHGGVSRFAKVRHLHESLRQGIATEADIARDIERYGVLVRSQLRTCREVAGAGSLLRRLQGQHVFVVSGGQQDEVREALGSRGWDFEDIFGSPRTKDEHFTHLRARGVLHDAVFFGDAAYDAEVSERFGVPFVFVAACSDRPDLEHEMRARGHRVVQTFEGLYAETADVKVPR